MLKRISTRNQFDKMAQRIIEDASVPGEASRLSGTNHVEESAPTPDSPVLVTDDGAGYEGFALGFSGLGGPDLLVESNKTAPDVSGHLSRLK